MQEEKWLPVVGYEGKYEVSNTGIVRSLERRSVKKGNKGSVYSYTIPSKVRKLKTTEFGYLTVNLSNGERGNVSHFFVHRLVAEAFTPNPDNKPQVHHADHNKQNNNISNLSWVTASENIIEAVKAGKFPGGFGKGLNNHMGKLSDEQVLEIIELRKSKSLKEIAIKYNICIPHASEVSRGKKRNLTKAVY